MKQKIFILVFSLCALCAQAGMYYNGFWFSPLDSDDSFRYVELFDCDLSGEVVIPGRFVADARDWDPPLDCIVTGIGDYGDPFKGKTDITAVVIPESIVKISSSKFEGCTGLLAISVSWADPSVVEMGENVFAGVNTGAVALHVPVGSKAAYQASEQWNSFNIVDDGQIATTQLSALTVSTGQLLPAFNPAVQDYRVIVPQSVSSLTLKATPAGDADISGDGQKTLTTGENQFKITVSRPEGLQRDYTVTVYRMAQDYTIELTSATAYSTQSKYLTDPVSSGKVYPSDRHKLQYVLTTGTVTGDIPLRFDLGSGISLDRVVTVAPYSMYEIMLEIEIRLNYGDCSLITHYVNGRPSWSEIDYPNQTTGTISISGNSGLLLVSEISLLSVPLQISFDSFLQIQGSAISTPEIPRITLYPNPVSESFRIEGLTASTQITVTDISGKTLLQQTVQGEENISIGHLSKGVYLIRVNGETTKIIKN
jgi:hypothetical protein